MRDDCLRYPALCRFIHAHFNQDWFEEGETARAVLRKFREWEDPEVRAPIVSDIDRIVREGLSDDALDHLLANLELDYDPEFEGLTNRAWLMLVRSELADEPPDARTADANRS